MARGSADAVTLPDGEIATIPVDDGPFVLDVSEATDRVYANNFFDRTVSVIDMTTNMVSTTFATTGQPNDVKVNETTGLIYVSEAASGIPGTERVYDEAELSLVATLPVPGAPGDVSINETTNRIYAAIVQPSFSVFEVTVIDGSTNTVAGHIPGPVDWTPSTVARVHVLAM